jgi:membrane associated rhomboid family serine protease
MTEPTLDSTTPAANRCYRHPDRETYVKCQRCGRPICGECQTLAPVGVHCPECVREARGSLATSARPLGRRFAGIVRTSGGRPIVTYTIIGLNLVVYLLQYLTGNTHSPITTDLWYAPVQTATEPWRMLTSIFIHESPLHVLLNMYSLFLVGPALESMLGRVRYLALFLVAGFGGSVGVLLIGTPTEAVLGASGAIFGLFGAYFIIARRLGGNATQFLVVIVLNLVIGFIPGFGIAWQAHVGGLITGIALAFVYLETRGRKRLPVQILLVAAVAIILVGATLVKVALFS